MVATDVVNNITTINFSFIVSGDVNGDGLVDIADMAKVKNHIIKVNLLQTPFSLAGDISSKGKISISDLLSIKKYILNITNTL